MSLGTSATNEEKLRHYLKRATLELDQAHERIAQLEAERGEPIAIVAMSCRFPGGTHSPEQLWELLAHGRDTVTEIPDDRGWDIDALHGMDAQPGFAPAGSFLTDMAAFDAGFFGISPREARSMDPQQRLVLESTWELLERGGIVPADLRGTRTGVFIGANSQSYAVIVASAQDDGWDHVITGNAPSIISGRVSYTLGLEGPSCTVDTACSSSLVAIHLASQALRTGECTLAVAGGVAVLCTPELFVEFSHQRGLAADGRCKPFAAAADGVGWSEGAGLVLLERLSDARRAGHPVLAVIRGSAVNSDGASSGLTAPNGPSQERVIQQALANAGLTTDQVDAVEAHGTGTRLGDPIEAQALLATYGRDRAAERPLWVGSIKSNIGHSAGAAGVAGVMKMVLALQHGTLPRTLHVDEPTPHVDWSVGAVSLLTEPRAWASGEEPRRAGVSAFGFSGTNAHLILEEAALAPAADATAGYPDGGEPVLPWLLSAKSERALRNQAGLLAAHVRSHPELSVADVAYSLAASRTSFNHRGVVVARDRDGFLAGLDTAAAGAASEELVRGRVRAASWPVFVFPGQGSQWTGMGRELLADCPPFAARMRECAAALAPFVSWNLLDVLGDEAALARMEVLQPALWAVMVSLAEAWRAQGVRPAAVVGTSQGEIAAACVAGALTLQDAARIVALRSEALRAIDGRGGMVSVALACPDAARLAAEVGAVLSVAAMNAPTSTVLAGAAEMVTRLLDACRAGGIFAHQVKDVGYASHSDQIELIRDELHDALDGIRPQRPDVPFYSTVTGRLATDDSLDAEYWYRNVRESIRLEETVRALLADGYNMFIEVSPHPVLCLPVRETAEAAGSDAAVLDTMQRGQGGMERFVTALARAHAVGAGVDWAPMLAAAGGRAVSLPTYPFQRQRYWPGVAALAAPPTLAPGRTEPGLDPEAGHVPEPEALPYADLPPAQRDERLFELIRDRVARVLAYPDPEAVELDNSFLEMGFDSVMAVELRNQLTAATGTVLPSTLVFEYPTPRALVGYLGPRVTRNRVNGAAQPDDVRTEPGPAEPAPAAPAAPPGQPAQPAPSGPSSLDSIEILFRHAWATGALMAANDLVVAAGRLRPSFGADAAAAHATVPVRLASGPARPRLICVPAVAMTAGPHQYARLAAELRGLRDAYALPNPGFVGGELIPATTEAMLAAHAQALTELADEPFVLAGHSGGGRLAHDLAGYLERHGMSPAGVVLLDTPWPEDQASDPAGLGLVRGILEREQGTTANIMNATRLTAMGGYHHIFNVAGNPTPLRAPVLLVRATHAVPTPDGSGGDIDMLSVRWRLPHEAVDVPGDHFTMLEEHAPAVARAVDEWLANLPQQPSVI